MQPARTLPAGRPWAAPLAVGLALVYCGQPPPVGAAATWTVTTTDDRGRGSLREAILEANGADGPALVRFDSETGPFATPQTIELASPLPTLAGETTIDGTIQGRLWKPTGVTVSGAHQHQVLRIAPGARVTVRSLTIADGRAGHGAGIANRGELWIEGVTFAGNAAEQDGGAVANLAGAVTAINSTFVSNRAGRAGGGLADRSGRVTVTNCTFSANRAPEGGGVFSDGTLLLRNTLLANSDESADCVATGTLDPASTHNLIEANRGCGASISSDDPRLGALGRYNGPTPTLPLESGSPAINLGDNASAVGERGQPLKWDQRGNGDPRFVAGITDIGAFEHQAFPVLTVDTAQDTELRGCTRLGDSDCSLRGAITLANAMGKPEVIRFDPKVFSLPRSIHLERPLPDVASDLAIDARGVGSVTVRGEVIGLRPGPAVTLTLHEVGLDKSR